MRGIEWIRQAWRRGGAQDPAESERGAGLVEYSLIMGLVVVLLVGALDYLSNSAEGELETRGESAAANGEAVGDLSIGSPPTTTASTSPPTTGPSGDVISATVQPITVTVTSESPGHRWNMSVLVTVVDSTGAPLAGAVVSGAFDGDTRSCTTDALGTCPLTRERIHQSTATMDFTLSQVTYENPSGASPPAIQFPAASTVTGTKP